MSERIRWSLSLWFIALLFNLLLTITLWGVLDTKSTLIAFAVSLLITLAIAQASEFEIVLGEKELIVGRAHIDYENLGAVYALDRDSMARARGVEIDPAAFFTLRFWIKTGVKVMVKDDRDPTPYWLISSKKYRELTRALESKIS